MINMNEFRIIKESKDPKILVVTPLLPGHKISKETKKTIKRNDIPFTWISSTGNNNIPTNLKLGLEWYKDLPPYYFMLDNDVILGRHLLDRLYEKLDNSKYNVAFSYASFSYKGIINRDFPADSYDINKLLQHNYISSNSLFSTYITMKVGLVTDNKYQRLLDHCFLLKLFYNGYIGIPCPEANFIAISSKDSISAGSKQEYDIKRMLVIEAFCNPIIEKYS